jgi:hypothetical protein
MRKLLSLPILVATLLLTSVVLVSCDAGSSSRAVVPTGGEDRVAIVPRLVRSSAITDSLFGATTRVRATIVNSAGDEIASQEADYGTGRLNLPAIDRDLEVKIRMDGYDASRILLWSGTSALKRARDHANSGVRASNTGSVTDVQIFSRLVPGGGGDPGLDQDSLAEVLLVGEWLTILYFNANDGTPLQMTALMTLFSDNKYALNQVYTPVGDTTNIFAGDFESGDWGVSGGIFDLEPDRLLVCYDSIQYKECDVPTGGSVNALPDLYVDADSVGSPRNYFLEIASGYIKVTDTKDRTNSQTWIPYSSRP